MKLFEIQYISRYYEQKIYASEVIQAKSSTEALKKFARMFQINEYTQIQEPNFTWNDNDWVSKFKCINEILEVDCPHCNGSGKIRSTDFGINN